MIRPIRVVSWGAASSPRPRLSSDLTPDALDRRTCLPPAYGWLLAELPRHRWSEQTLPPVASHWLAIHQGFRQAQATMDQAIAAHRAGEIDAAGLHPRLIPTLGGFLQHLDGHHRIESGHYFPQFRRLEPRIQAGIDLLDRDHDSVHAHLEVLAEYGRAFHQAVTARAPAEDAARRLAEAIDRASRPLIRHLDDEEDIVIPLMALRSAGG